MGRFSVYTLKFSCAVFLVFTVALSAFSQTADEKTALKKLGNKGFVVYEKDKAIYKYVLDGTGEVAPAKLVDGAYAPSVSQDGAYIAYVTADVLTGPSKNCYIWVMRSDGTDKRKIIATALQYVSGTNFDNKNNLVYTTGPITVRTTENMPQQLWTTDLQGNATKLLDYGGTGSDSYMYISHFDKHDDWVTWRWNARAYVGIFKGTAKASSYASVKDMGQRCGNSFNPTGDKITINSVDHKSVTIWARSNTTWSASTTVITSATKHTNMRWSNIPKWMLMRKEEVDADCYAVNMENIAERVRITFAGSTHGPNVFIGDITATAPWNGRAAFALAPRPSHGPEAFALNGRGLQRTGGTAVISLERLGNAHQPVLPILK